MIEQHYTPEFVAERLSVSVDTIYRRIHAGQIKAVELPFNSRSTWRIPHSEVERFLNGENPAPVLELRRQA